jgi:diaminopimelate epimerase
LEKNVRGLTIGEVAQQLKLNRHTVTRIFDRLLIEKKVDYEEKGLTKIFFSTGSNKFVGKITQGKDNDIWVDIFRPKYDEEFIRLNQTKHDYLIRASSNYRSVGAIALNKSHIDEMIEILKRVKKGLK